MYSTRSNRSSLPCGLRRAAALAAVCALTTVWARAAITLDIQPNRAQIYLGESFLLNVTVNGADEGVPAPDLSALAADVQLLGSQSRSSRSFSFVNGQMSRSETLARLFAFQVKPRAAGVFATGPVRFSSGGQRQEARGPDVLVVGQEAQDLVAARVAASREAVLVDEPFTITACVTIAGLPPPNERVEPLAPSTPPRLECAFLGQAEIPGLQSPDLQQVLQGLVSRDPRAPAFHINDFQSQGPDLFGAPFGDFDPFRPRPIRFRLTPVAAVRNSRACHEYTLSLTYTPKQEGDYTFGPLAFKGAVITGADPRGQPILRQISCVGPAVTVRVVPPPETNRPDCFIGSVGSNLAVRAELDASICKVGDPLTLTLEVTGALSLANMRPPVLNLQPGLARDFRVYDDNVESSAIPTGKRFRYRIRPLHEGTLEVPPIAVAWFDTGSRTYLTASTQPIPVQARANTQLVSDSGTNHPSPVTRLAVERTTTTPSAITVAEAGAGTDSLLPPARLLLLLAAAGPLLFVLAWLATLLHRHRASLSAAHRRSRALPQALAALRTAAGVPRPNAAPAGHAIRAFLAARLGVAGGALTPAEVSSLLQAHGVPQGSAAACGALLARLDQALYQPDAAASETADVIREAQSLLPRVAAELDHPPMRKEDAQ